MKPTVERGGSGEQIDRQEPGAFEHRIAKEHKRQQRHESVVVVRLEGHERAEHRVAKRAQAVERQHRHRHDDLQCDPQCSDDPRADGRVRAFRT